MSYLFSIYVLMYTMGAETDFDTSYIYFQVRKIKQCLDPNVENNGKVSRFKLDLFFFETVAKINNSMSIKEKRLKSTFVFLKRYKSEYMKICLQRMNL